MNIWDSVQRGLEKATQEATRIARTQRLRSTIDSLTRQMHTQEEDLLARTMEVFAAGQLIQGELLPICQELARLQQQLEQNRQELAQLQSQGAQPTTTRTGQASIPSPSSYTPGSDLPPTTYAPPPPDYKPYDATMPAPLPPPPPGVEPLTISSFHTVREPTSANEKQLCKQCGTELIPGNAYCHNCGAAVQSGDASYQPTIRGSVEQETIRATSDEETPYASVTEQPTIYHAPSSAPTQGQDDADSLSKQTNKQDGGD
ncbi:MAG: hypothetical protein M3Y39_07360 [Chloroflexota bacterium]|nr:hypothetical protein [Chloroflexota bacterium]